MAQIIKHRRGSLESVSGATKRAGELLVVTGSAGISATNGDTILFVGVDGSTVTPANKILQGSVVPNLQGSNYDTSIDGIPYYDTTNQKLFILNKGGNVEVKATANTGGTGIVSGSSQITISETTGYSEFSSSIATEFSASNSDLTALSASVSNVTGQFSSSVATSFVNVEASQSAQDGRLDSLESFTSSIDATIQTKLNVDGVISGSSQVNADSITNFDANVLAYNNSLNVFSGSSQVNADSITNFDSNVKDALNVNSVISGSSQVQIDSVTGFTAFSSSADARLVSLEDAIGEGSNIDGRLTDLETFQASEEGKNDTLATYTGSVDTTLSNIATDQTTQDGRLDNLEGFQSDVETAIAFDGQNVTINGNFNVTGTQTIVNSTTVQIGDNIIELNGSAAANGGLYVKDATAPNTATGSLIWDSTNDQWKAGVKDSEIKILLAGGDSVVSGSSQITISDTNGYSDFSSSLATSISASVAASTFENLVGKPSGLVSGSQQVIDLLPAGVVSGSSQVVSNLVSQNVNLGGISGSTLNITGNAKIDGNLVLGGNITIGDASGDTISFGGEVSSDIIPATTNTYDLGSSTNKFAEVHAMNLYGTINGSVNATNGVVSGSQQVTELLPTGVVSGSGQFAALLPTGVVSGSSQITYASISSIPAGIVSGSTQITDLLPTGVVSGSSQVVSSLLNQATDFGTGRVSADSIGNADGSSTITGSFVGDGSGLTGLVSSLNIAGDSGTDTIDLLTDTLTIEGDSIISVAVSDNTISISAGDASTSAKGVASFTADDFDVTTGNVSIKDGGVRAANLNADVAGTGISLNNSDNSLEVDFGSTAGTAVEGNTSLTVQGTANEIEISGGAITLGGGGTVTVSLPTDVTIANDLTVTNDLLVSNDLTITGNLFVNGTTTTIDSTTIQLGDNIIELNGSAGANGGLLVKDVTNPNTASGSLLWDSTNDYWKGGAEGSEYQFARLNSTPTSGSVQVIAANGLLVDSDISDDGTNVTVGTDLIINGLTASSFVVSNGSKKLISVTPSNAGDIIQWNGSSFVASNEIDGGTF